MQGEGGADSGHWVGGGGTAAVPPVGLVEGERRWLDGYWHD